MVLIDVIRSYLDMTKILRLPEVLERTGLSRSMLYKLMDQGMFPASVKIGMRATGWVDQEIDEWIETRIMERKK